MTRAAIFIFIYFIYIFIFLPDLGHFHFERH